MRDESQSQVQYSVPGSKNFVFSFLCSSFVVCFYFQLARSLVVFSMQSQISLKISYPSRIGIRIRLETWVLL